MKRSKRIEALDRRAVNKDGFIDEWPEMGFVAMHSPYDPKPSVKIENNIITELDGKKREDFDFLDQFIADYAIRTDRAEASMAVPSLEIARKIVDINVSRKEILEIVSGITPAKMAEVINCLNVVEMMMGMQKMRARKIPGNQAHITNLKDDPVQIAADAAEGALRGFSEEETTMGVARYAPFSAMALLIGSQAGRPGVLTQCSAEEATELELGIRGLTTYAETISVYGTEKVFIDGVKLFIFSNPNNPVGCIYSYEEICEIASLAKKYNVTLIVDELYSRQIYPGITYTHLCAQKEIPENLVTIMGPSKTESLSGYRLGAAFGNAEMIERMEKLQAIMSLRCSGYNQAVFTTWFNEPEGWMTARTAKHKEIHDVIMEKLAGVPGVYARPAEGGSYLFIRIPELDISLHHFIRIVREMADVTVTPGTEFDPKCIWQFRINFSQDKDKAVAGIERLLQIMERYRKQK